MAARVLLLGILFTEVIESAYSAGSKRNVAVTLKNGPKSEEEVFEAEIASTRGNAKIFLDVKPKNQLVLGKKSLTFSCWAGPTYHDITWLYNGNEVPPCGPAQCTITKSGSLHLFRKNLEKKKSNIQKRKGRDGNNTNIFYKNNQKHEFRCVARDKEGAAIRSAPVNILISDLRHGFNIPPYNSTITEGEVAKFSCSIDSIPSPPNIIWQRNQLTINNINDTRYIFPPDGSLYIRDTKLSDAGSYRCVVTNSYVNKTKQSKEAKLTINPKNNFEIAKLLPQDKYTYTLIKGSNLTLVCAASGHPFTIGWVFNAKQSDENAIDPKTLTRSTNGISILELKNISANDAGVYSCSMQSNRSQETQNIIVKVNVPPTFVKKPLNQICPNGRTARFECQAQGFPKPRIHWLFNAENITLNRRLTVYEKENNKNELAITSTVPSDSGIYQCIAVNEAGEIWAAGRLYVNTSRNSPAAPTSLKCHALSPVQIYISWKPPKLMPSSSITAYTVHYSSLDGGKEEVSPPEPGNSTSVVITKLLEPFTNYSFYIRVYNNHGASDQSASITCSTFPGVAKSAPKITLDPFESNRLNVTWETLSKREAQGVVVEYKLQWKLSEHPTIRPQYLPSNTVYYTIDNLLADESYDVRVFAKTQEGWPNITETYPEWVSITMPPLEFHHYIREELVGLYVVYVNYTAIKVKWAVPNTELINFDKWEIFFDNANGTSIFNTDLNKDIDSYEFHNLDLNGTYNIKLCTISLAQDPYCVKQTISMKNSSYNVPIELEAFPVTPNSIKVKWKMKDKGHKSGNFQICYREVNNYSNKSANCVTSSDMFVTIPRLKYTSLYEFKVKSLENIPEENIFSEIVECFTKREGEKIEKYESKTKKTIFERRPFAPDVIVRNNPSWGPSSPLDEAKPVPNSKVDQSLGVILGITISLICICICLCSMYCRKKYENLRSFRESAQPVKTCVITRNGDNCYINHSTCEQGSTDAHEIELAVLCPHVPALSSTIYCDAKGVQANGLIEPCVKEPLLKSHGIPDGRKDLRIIENPQHKQKSRDCQQQDFNSTQITTLHYDIRDSHESLRNNNFECEGHECLGTQKKTAPTIVPILPIPNG